MSGGPTSRATFLGMCAAECRKLRGRGLLYAVLLFGACHGLLAAAAVKGMQVLGNKFTEGQLGKEVGDPLDLTVVADLSLTLAVFPVNGFVLLFLFSIIWAEDFSLGTMAMIFSRPVARLQVFASKAAASLAVGTLSVVLATGTAAVLGLILFGADSDVSMLQGAPVVGWMVEVPGVGDRLLRVASGLLAGSLLLMPLIAVAALVGSLSRSPVLTLFGSMLLLFADFFAHTVLGIWGGTDFDGHEAADQLSHWTIWSGRDLFDAHGPWSSAWTGAAADPATTALTEAATSLAQTPWSVLGQPLAATLAYTLIVGVLAVLVFCKRDVT